MAVPDACEANARLMVASPEPGLAGVAKMLCQPSIAANSRSLDAGTIYPRRHSRRANNGTRPSAAPPTAPLICA